MYLEKLEGRGTRERENYVARDWYGTDMVVRLRKPSLQIVINYSGLIFKTSEHVSRHSFTWQIPSEPELIDF